MSSQEAKEDPQNAMELQEELQTNNSCVCPLDRSVSSVPLWWRDRPGMCILHFPAFGGSLREWLLRRPDPGRENHLLGVYIFLKVAKVRGRDEVIK